MIAKHRYFSMSDMLTIVNQKDKKKLTTEKLAKFFTAYFW